MDFNLLQAFTGRKPRSLDHLPLTRRYAVRIAGDNAHLNNEGQRTIPSLQTLRGYFPGPFNGADVTVKDTKRYAATGGWGFYNFNHHEPKAPTATLKPREECA